MSDHWEKNLIIIGITFVLYLFCAGCGGGSINSSIDGYFFGNSQSDNQNSEQEGAEFGETTTWTVLAYINGDTCDIIEGPSLVPVMEFEQVGSTDDVNVVVQRDLCQVEPTTVQRLYVKQGEGNSEIVQDLGEQDMGDYEVFMDFIRWGTENYPADKYILYFYGHGSGWYVRDREWEEPEATARQAGAFIYDYNGDDENYPTTMDIHQLRYVLEKTAFHPEIVIFGPCMMGTIEVAYELKDVADILIASEETTKYFGGNIYAETLQMLVDDTDMSEQELASVFVQKYVASLERMGEGENFWATLAAIDLSKVDALAESLDTFGLELAGVADETVENIWDTQNFSTAYYRDIYHFSSIMDTESGNTVKADIQNAIISFDKHGEGVQNANGLSIYLTPSPGGSYWAGYGKLRFSQDTQGWMNYLSKLAE